ncbi:hypothetical protein GIB67_033231 [Kingdonia uniflora]|uniref:Uncharacterized protein n=1 Tax=Kingdonia uniflora TaxID=39325 RepID=A0A7J7MPS5_9MAGN|nr:hypothetical protein GIB67_033231 [Kingdonia uniflora]
MSSNLLLFRSAIRPLISSIKLQHISIPTRVRASSHQLGRCVSSNAAAAAVIVSKDESYGNKQIIRLSPQLYNYLLANVREPEV